MKAIAVILSVVCVATVLSELAGLGLLWYRGQLNPDTIADVRLALTGEDDALLEVDESTDKSQPSRQDYEQQRITRILELGTRTEELNMLKRIITDSRKGLTDEQGSFEQHKTEFETELKELQQAASAAAMEQTRGILLALRPADAVDHLMALPAEQNVLLLQGMPEKSIARILEQFLGGADDQRVRGQEIFKALSLGDPSRSLIDDALRNLAGTGPPAGNN